MILPAVVAIIMYDQVYHFETAHEHMNTMYTVN